MSLLVRKIEKGKWLQNDILNGQEISADAITNCMKTIRNTLSTWHIANEEQIDDAVLAIVSAHQHLDTIDVVYISQDKLNKFGISMKNTPGQTPVDDLIVRTLLLIVAFFLDYFEYNVSHVYLKKIVLCNLQSYIVYYMLNL